MSCHGQSMRLKGKSWNNVSLIGMPGAGKSTVGVVLAKMLGLDFVDVDLLIQKAQGKTLQALIDEHGTEQFLSLEEEALLSIKMGTAACAQEDTTLLTHASVIATGGSAVYSEKGMHHLGALGTVVYLQVSYEELVSRLGSLDERGVVFRGSQEHSDLKSLYEERTPLYEKHACVVVNVDGLSVSEAASKVAAAL